MPDLTGKDRVQAAQRLSRLAELGLHRACDRGGDDPALGHVRAVPLLTEVADVAAAALALDGGPTTEL